MKFYDKDKIDFNNLIFSKKALIALLIPLVIEQILNSLMGVFDTIMVSRVGSASISAVSNVDQINILVIQVFSALATGAVIICSQYLGRDDRKNANETAKQVIFTVLMISCLLSLCCVVFRKSLLNLIYGSVEAKVMRDSLTYFLVTALSFPALSLFSAGSAFYRAGGNARFPMKISVISNVLNIAGNAVLIFVFHMGVLGAALSTLFSRIFAMICIFLFLRLDKQPIVVRNYFSIRPDIKRIKTILSVGIPAGVENGMFQFGKLAIQSSVATLSTREMAAQAVTITLEGLNGMAGIGIGIGMMTVVGQAIGANKLHEAKYYIVKLTVMAEIVVTFSCALIFALTPLVTKIAGFDATTADICYEMMLAITIAKPLVWTLAFVPPYGLRAAGDVKFTMVTSMIIMWTIRVSLCIFLIRAMGFGPIAVWIAMIIDWTVRAFIYSGRFLGNKWYKHHII